MVVIGLLRRLKEIKLTRPVNIVGIIGANDGTSSILSVFKLVKPMNVSL
jgi:hypothetical protein